MKLSNVWNKILYFDSFNSKDPLNQSKSVIFNFLLLFVTVIIVFLVFVNGHYGHKELLIIDISVLIFLITPSCVLIYFRKGRLAVHIFLSGLMILAFIGVRIAMGANRFTGGEYLFIPLAIVGLVMFEKSIRLIYVISGLMALVYFKYFKFSQLGLLHHKDFPLELINTGIVTMVTIFIVFSFKNAIFQALLQAREQQKMVYSLIDNLPLFIALLDGEGKYVIVNQQYEQGFQRPMNEIIGKHYKEVLPNNLLETHDDFMVQALEGKSPNFSQEVKLPDGSHTYVNGKYYPIFNDSFKVEYVTVYVTDITELKMTENRLKESNKTKNELFSIISHDLRSPLILLSNVLSLAEIQEFSREDFKVFTKEIQQKLKVVFNTMDNVLSWARSQMEQISSFPENISLNEIIAENIMLYNQLAVQKQLEVVFQPERDYQIYADKNHISLIYRNLIHNGLKFTKTGGIYFSIKEKNGHTSVEMKDTGVGMTPDIIKKLLDQSNVNSTVGTDGEMGTGLGMSVSLGLLKMNNGKITISSREGEGTVFTLVFPTAS